MYTPELVTEVRSLWKEETPCSPLTDVQKVWIRINIFTFTYLHADLYIFKEDVRRRHANKLKEPHSTQMYIHTSYRHRHRIK